MIPIDGSQDIEKLDRNLADSLQSVNISLASFFSSSLVVIMVFPLFILPASVLGYVYHSYAIAYLNTGRDLRRMESTSHSPIFSGFRELLEGVVTVRAFSAEIRFLNSLHTKIDLTTRMWYAFWMTNRWLCVRYNMIGALIVFITMLLASSGVVDAGWAALCITSAMAFTANIYWVCRNWTQLELDLNSVERVVEYLNLPQEPPAMIENSRPPAHWPSSTGPNSDTLIAVEDLQVRYAPELPAVLHGITFSLKARERIGILGRTGSGKSTLAKSVLRFVEPVTGKIILDGINISTIGISDLRSRLTFIPQEASLFSGTLRDNLDPFGDYTDEQCLNALYRVRMLSDRAHRSPRSSEQHSRAPSVVSTEQGSQHIATTVESDTASTLSEAAGSLTALAVDLHGNKSARKVSLDSKVSAGGLNFSAGQRQLIAMARALLRQSTVVIMDEATSSIDFATDAKIQAAIREEFQNSLLITST